MSTNPPFSIFKLCITAFTSGAVVMSMELVGSRLFAPYLGTSLFVWTSLIGVILAALSLGYFVGGRLSDTKPNLLIQLIILAAAALLFIESTQTPILLLLLKSNLDVRTSAVIAAILLFAIPSILLGCITPFVTRLSITRIDDSGSKVGLIYAISTMGSIFGTFLTGFYLFSLVGCSILLLLLATVLVVLVVFLDFKKSFIPACLLVMVIALLAYSHLQGVKKARDNNVHILDTAYHRVIIFDKKEENGRTKRYLSTDPFGVQSQMYIDKPNELSGGYSKFYDLGVHLTSKSGNFLLLGGGAYSYPKYFSHTFPEAKLSVVEIDEQLIDLAKKYFFYEQRPNIEVIHKDARRYLQSDEKIFDAIFIDVFNSAPEVPFHLTTWEFFELSKSRLDENGYILMNLISAPQGIGSRFFMALVNTMGEHFENLMVFALDPSRPPKESQNLLLLATNSEHVNLEALPLAIKHLTNNIIELDIADNETLLSDDYAPVESLMLGVYATLNNQNTN